MMDRKRWYPIKAGDKRRFTEGRILEVMRTRPNKSWKVWELVAKVFSDTAVNKRTYLLPSLSCAISIMANRAENPPGRWGGCAVVREKRGYYRLKVTEQPTLPEVKKPELGTGFKKCPFSPASANLQCKDCRLSEKIVTDPETRDTYYVCAFNTMVRDLNSIKKTYAELVQKIYQ